MAVFMDSRGRCYKELRVWEYGDTEECSIYLSVGGFSLLLSGNCMVKVMTFTFYMRLNQLQFDILNRKYLYLVKIPNCSGV